MMNLKALSIDDIKKWNLTLSQARNYLREEQRKGSKLSEQLHAAQLELVQAAQSFQKIPGIGMPKFDVDNAELEAILAAISNLRAQNIAMQVKINRIKAQTRQLKQKQVEINNVGRGAVAHEKYARVMNGLSMAADVRETWSSDDVLEIDDVVMETGISYDEAKDMVEQKRSSWRTGEAPPEDL